MSRYIARVFTSNYASGRNGRTPLAFVIHKPEGENNSIIPYLQEVSTQKSYHYIIGLNGVVTQLVSPDDTAWASGVVTNPTWPDLIQGANPNEYTINIALEGFAANQETQPQLAALYCLIADLANDYGIALTDLTVVFHREINGAKTCPGFHLNKFDVVKGADACLTALQVALADGITTNSVAASENVDADANQAQSSIPTS